MTNLTVNNKTDIVLPCVFNSLCYAYTFLSCFKIAEFNTYIYK